MTEQHSDQSLGNTSAEEKPSDEQLVHEKLSPEDQQRVAKYLSSPIHSVERKPFRPYFMMLMLVAVVIALGLLSRLITYFALD